MGVGQVHDVTFLSTVRSNTHISTIARELDNRTTRVNAIGIENVETLETENGMMRNEMKVNR